MLLAIIAPVVVLGLWLVLAIGTFRCPDKSWPLVQQMWRWWETRLLWRELSLLVLVVVNTAAVLVLGRNLVLRDDTGVEGRH